MTFAERLDNMPHGSYTLQGCDNLSDQFLIAIWCLKEGFSVVIGEEASTNERYVFVWKKAQVN